MRPGSTDGGRPDVPLSAPRGDPASRGWPRRPPLAIRPISVLLAVGEFAASAAAKFSDDELQQLSQRSKAVPTQGTMAERIGSNVCEGHRCRQVRPCVIHRPRLASAEDLEAKGGDLRANVVVADDQELQAIVGDPDVDRLLLIARSVRCPCRKAGGEKRVVSSSPGLVPHVVSIADASVPTGRWSVLWSYGGVPLLFSASVVPVSFDE